VFSIYSLGGYNETNWREVDQELFFKEYLGERGERVQSFKTDVDLQSPRLDASNLSLSQYLVGGIQKSPRARRGRVGGRQEKRGGCGQTVKELKLS
jgi:hypothetical protein